MDHNFSISCCENHTQRVPVNTLSTTEDSRSCQPWEVLARTAEELPNACTKQYVVEFYCRKWELRLLLHSPFSLMCVPCAHQVRNANWERSDCNALPHDHRHEHFVGLTVTYNLRKPLINDPVQTKSSQTGSSHRLRPELPLPCLNFSPFGKNRGGPACPTTR